MSESIGGRLHRAIRAWAPRGGRPDRKHFAAVMSGRLSDGGQKGVSYRSILSYFEDSSEPSLEWLRHAADVLGVAPEWLAFGVGQPAEGIPDEVDIRLDALRRIVREEIERASVVLTTHTR